MNFSAAGSLERRASYSSSERRAITLNPVVALIAPSLIISWNSWGNEANFRISCSCLTLTPKSFATCSREDVRLSHLLCWLLPLKIHWIFTYSSINFDCFTGSFFDRPKFDAVSFLSFSSSSSRSNTIGQICPFKS